MTTRLTLRNLLPIIGLSHLEGKGNASKMQHWLRIMHMDLTAPVLIYFCGLFSYSDADYFKQALRQGGPAKSKEPRIPRMPQL